MKNNQWKFVFIVAVVIGGILSLFASSFPDGLNKVAEVQGFLTDGKQLIAGVMPNYQVPGIAIENISKSLAGVFGTCIVFGLLFFAGKFLYSFNTEKKN